MLPETLIRELRQAQKVLEVAIDIRIEILLTLVRSNDPSEDEISKIEEKITDLSAVLRKVEKYLYVNHDWRRDYYRRQPTKQAVATRH